MFVVYRVFLDQFPKEESVKSNRSMSVSEQLCTYPSPNSTLTLTCHQLTGVGLGEGRGGEGRGRYAISQILTLI